MKAFLTGLVLAVGLAAGAGYVLEGYFAGEADHTFSTSYARVGEENSVEHRNFNGAEEAGRQQ